MSDFMGETLRNGGIMKKRMKDTITHTRPKNSNNGVPRIKDVRENTKVLYIMFNNHWRKQSVDAANAMKKLLGIEPSHEQKGGALTDYFS